MSHKIAFVCIAAALIISLSASAGEGKKGLGGGIERGGPIAQILEHAKDLDLTPDQKNKLEELQKEFQKEMAGKVGNGELRDKLKDHPELLKEMKEARESGDEAKMKAMREKMREHLMKNGGPAEGAKGGDIREKLAAILSPEQMKKIKEMREKNGGAGPGGKTEQGQKPDTSKEAPKVFE